MAPIPILLRVVITSTLLSVDPTAGWAAWIENGAPVRINATTLDDHGIASDGAGGAYLCWAEGSVVRVQRLLAAGDVAPGWGAQGTMIAESLLGSPIVLEDGSGGAYIAWTRSVALAGGGSERDVRVVRVQGDGLMHPGWPAAGLPVDLPPGGELLRDAISDGMGGVVLAIHGGDNKVHVARVGDDGSLLWVRSTCEGQATACSAQQHGAPRLARDGSGGAFVVWIRTPGAARVYVQHISATGTPSWEPGRELIANGAQAEVALLSPERALVVWGDSRNSASSGQDIWGAIVDGLNVTQFPICSATDDQRFPHVEADGVGGALVLWEDRRGGVRNELYLQRLDASGNPAAGWPADGLRIASQPHTASTDDNSTLVARGTGGAVIVWGDARDSGQDIYATAIRGDGHILSHLPADGIPLCVAGGSQARPLAVSDARGGAIVAWIDARTSNSDLYANHISAEAGVVAAESDPPRAGALSVEAVFPNPARGSVSFAIQTATNEPISIFIVDASGRRVRTLRGTGSTAAWHVVRWDGQDDAIALAPSGIYFLHVRGGGHEARRKFALLR